MPDPEFKIPTGYSAPFAVVTDSDHTAWLLIATALGLCLILLEQDHTYSWVPSTGAAARNGPLPRQTHGDGISVDSNDSRQVIMRKDTSFQVSYSNRDI